MAHAFAVYSTPHRGARYMHQTWALLSIVLESWNFPDFSKGQYLITLSLSLCWLVTRCQLHGTTHKFWQIYYLFGNYTNNRCHFINNSPATFTFSPHLLELSLFEASLAPGQLAEVRCSRHRFRRLTTAYSAELATLGYSCASHFALSVRYAYRHLLCHFTALQHDIFYRTNAIKLLLSNKRFMV